MAPGPITAPPAAGEEPGAAGERPAAAAGSEANGASQPVAADEDGGSASSSPIVRPKAAAAKAAKAAAEAAAAGPSASRARSTRQPTRGKSAVAAAVAEHSLRALTDDDKWLDAGQLAGVRGRQRRTTGSSRGAGDWGLLPSPRALVLLQADAELAASKQVAAAEMAATRAAAAAAATALQTSSSNCTPSAGRQLIDADDNDISSAQPMLPSLRVSCKRARALFEAGGQEVAGSSHRRTFNGHDH
jgi:hypothetical protein